MKREIVAAALLLLLLAASLCNIGRLDRLIKNVEDELDRAACAAEDGDNHASQDALRRAHATWDRARNYTHIFIRHTEIDAVSDAFHVLEGELEINNKSSVTASFRLLRYHLDSILEMEQIRLGSILSLISCR